VFVFTKIGKGEVQERDRTWETIERAIHDLECSSNNYNRVGSCKFCLTMYYKVPTKCLEAAGILRISL
jgi:hypothetical protein